MVSALGELIQQKQWSGLKSVGMVVCERRLWNKTTKEPAFYISSLSNDAQVLAHAVRSHWGIENGSKRKVRVLQEISGSSHVLHLLNVFVLLHQRLFYAKLFGPWTQIGHGAGRIPGAGAP